MSTLLLLDTGITHSNCPRHVSIFRAPEEESNGSIHALKSSQLIFDKSNFSPNLKLLFWDYRIFNSKEVFIQVLHNLERELGRIPIVSHPYSAPANGLQTVLNEKHLFGDELDTALHIASIGHDGEERGRFPGAYRRALSVGVCDEFGLLKEYCGTLGANKPDLVTQDTFEVSIDSETHAYSGTSGAVCAISGWAFLVFMHLSKEKKHVPAVLTKSALLSLARPVSSKNYRVIASLPDLRNLETLFVSSERRETGVRVSVSNLSKLTISIVAASSRSSSNFLSPAISLSVRLQIDGIDIGEFSAEDRICFDELKVSREVRIFIFSDLPADIGFSCFGNEKVHIHKLDNRRNRMHRPLRIVGISASHDASACVIEDGVVKRAVQLERITRVKHDGRSSLYSADAVRYCLDSLNIHERDIDYFSFNIQALVPGYHGLSQPICSDDFDLFSPFGDRSIFVSHHLAHAFSAFSLSGFDNALVIVADGSGGTVLGSDDICLSGPDFRSYLNHYKSAPERRLHVFSAYEFNREKYKLIDREVSPSFNTRCGSSSIGEAYAAVANYIFGDFQASGKVMGLSPYGNKNSFESFLEFDENGNLSFSSSWKEKFTNISKQGSARWRGNVDLAARIQADFELSILSRVKRVLQLSKARKIAYAGGLALNCVTNGRIVREMQLADFFVPSAASDAGISLGAAFAAHHLVTKSLPSYRAKHDFWGHPYSIEDISVAKASLAHIVKWKRLEVADIASMLEKGACLGIFESSSEFGPRALGHRSIVADPRNKDRWNFINKLVKFREDFRPFAPIVCVDDVEEFFESCREHVFMTETVLVRHKYRDKLAAVTHVDGTARVQTVRKETHPFLYDLLKSFGALTGIPVLLNTSFNVQGQPVVETPLQAIELLTTTAIEGVYFPQLMELVQVHSIKDFGSTSDDLMFSWGADASMSKSVSGHEVRTIITGRYRKKSALTYPSWVFDFLFSLCHEGKTLGEALSFLNVPQEGVDVVAQLLQKKYLLIKSDRT